MKKKKLKSKISKLQKENELLKSELIKKGNVFFQENKSLGVNKTSIGFVRNGVIEVMYNY